MHEVHEHIEHAGHAAHGEASSLPQYIGITIAILGVVMALCTAQVGAARTELIATMVEESAAKAKSAAVANKYRALQAQLQQLHAAMPDLARQKQLTDQLKALGSGTKNSETNLLLQAAGLNTERVLNTVTPTEKDVQRFLVLLSRTREEYASAKHWAESYRDAVKVHESTADRFELAMLAAEIGIVIASVGLLLARQRLFARSAWFVAIALGILSVSVATVTKLHNDHVLHAAEEKIQATEHHFQSVNRDEEDIAEDKKLEQDIEAEFKEMNRLSGSH